MTKRKTPQETEPEPTPVEAPKPLDPFSPYAQFPIPPLIIE